MYAIFLQLQKENPDGIMRHFTRLLHRTVDDELSAIVPTVRVDPRRPSCNTSCDFAVGDRVDAFLKFTKTPEFNLTTHLLIAESDYLFIGAVQRGNLPEHNNFIGFPFGYILPDWPEHVDLAHRFFPGDLASVPQSGPAPALLTTRTFKRIAPVWADVQNQMDNDTDAVKTYGWVRDMYSFDFALAKRKIRAFTPSEPWSPLMVQIPADSEIGEAVLIHYTWSPIISVNGTKLWSFDKRSYSANSVQNRTFPRAAAVPRATSARAALHRLQEAPGRPGLAGG